MSAAKRIQFPTSPLRPNVLQPSPNGIGNLLNSVGGVMNLGKSLDASAANVALLKPAQVLTASADSTEGGDGEENKNKNGGNGCTKRRQQRKSKRDELAIAGSIPFVKHHHSVKKPQTPSVSRRNARERNRVRQVNDGFSTLRTHIPHLKAKTSKVDTLRAAVEYIRALRQLVGEDDAADEYSGPVLITDEMSSPSPKRSTSALSGEINPMVYQLPSMSSGAGNSFTIHDHSSPRRSDSSSPESAAARAEMSSSSLLYNRQEDEELEDEENMRFLPDDWWQPQASATPTTAAQ